MTDNIFLIGIGYRARNGKDSVANFIKQNNVYAAGRLDRDSEGLLLLTDDGRLQHNITDPKNKMPKTYWAQVEGEIDDAAIKLLQKGVTLKDGLTKPAKAKKIPQPENLWPRQPPIRERKNIPTSWVELTITEGRNRQVRRIMARVGFKVKALKRTKIGNIGIKGLAVGGSRKLTKSQIGYLRKVTDLSGRSQD